MVDAVVGDGSEEFRKQLQFAFPTALIGVETLSFEVLEFFSEQSLGPPHSFNNFLSERDGSKMFIAMVVVLE